MKNILATIVLAVALSPIIGYNIYKYKCRTTKAFEQH